MIQCSGEETEVMSKLGLTTSEAKVYLALTQIGESQIGLISKATGIQRTHLYQVLRSLEKKGLVEKEIDTNSKYKAESPTEALDLLVKGKKEQIFQIETRAKIIAENLIKQAQARNQTIRDTQKEGYNQFTLIPGKAVFHRLREMLQRSQESVNVVTTQTRFSPAITEFANDCEKALVRGVKIRVITEDYLLDETAMEMMQNLRKRPSFKVRCLLSFSPGTIVTIVDKKEACVILSSTASFIEAPALWVSNSCLIAVLQNYFEDMWNTSPIGSL